MAAPCSLSRCVVSPAGTPSAAVIFLHGSGDTGPGIKSWIREILKKDLAFGHIRVIFPTAPPRPYTPMMGGISNVWFDRYKISINSPEHLDSITSMCRALTDLIQEEAASGVAKDRILLGGFSMGGAMAMHLAYRYHRDVAGVFALSSFLNEDSVVYKCTHLTPGTPPDWKEPLQRPISRNAKQSCMDFSHGEVLETAQSLL